MTMLNGLWLSFFAVAAVAAVARWLGGDPAVWAAMVESLFAMAKLSVEVMILLFGTLTLWLGFLRIAEKAGLVDVLGRLLAPLFARLMPEVPRGHPALGFITLNFAANGLGLDNAATPIGLKAMKALQELNPSATVASNAQILFLVLNASSLTLLPVSIFMYRAQQGAADPTLVFLPILLATSASTLVGLLSVAFMQRLKLWDPGVLAYLLPDALLLGGFMALLAGLSATAVCGGCAACVGRTGSIARWHPLVRHRSGTGHALCRSAANGAGQTVLRQRRARHADRDHADPRRRQLPGTGGGDRSGQHRNHLLRAGGVLRRGGHPARASRGRLRPARRPRRGAGGHRRVLLVLWLKPDCACVSRQGNSSG